MTAERKGAGGRAKPAPSEGGGRPRSLISSWSALADHDSGEKHAPQRQPPLRALALDDLEFQVDGDGVLGAALDAVEEALGAALADLVAGQADAGHRRVHMAQHVEVMIAAVVVAVASMFWASGPIAAFVSKHPTTKMLALAFLVLIGVSLAADGLGFHIDKGYIYAAMAFAVLVEAINIF